MELSLSGNSLKTLNRSITSLARVGTELVLQASPSQLEFNTLNSSRSAYQSITLKPYFFDVYSLRSSSHQPIRCSVLLKSVCSVLRTPVSTLESLSILLSSSDAYKLQWILQCHNGARKTYWISCNLEPDIQGLSIERDRFPSSFVVRPRDLTRLLANFQSSLQEITIIATEPSAVPSDAAEEIGGKAVELRSYIDPTKDNSDAALHTQLWIDPVEEFSQYTHAGDAVDVTFGVKELKAFLSFCEGCEVDIHLFFEKAGEPILMAPKFGFDDGSNSDFDATLVLATMLVSQLNETTTTGHPPVASVPNVNDVHGNDSHSRAANPSPVPEQPSPVPEQPSDRTKIWSDLSGSAAKSSDGTRDRRAQMEGNSNSSMERPNIMNVSKIPPGRANESDIRQQLEADNLDEPQDRAEMNDNPFSQHHPSNWVGACEADDEEDEEELYVQSTPHFYE